MDSLTELVHDLNKLITEYRFEDVLAKFYDEEIISVENKEPPVMGLPAYREGRRNSLKMSITIQHT